MKHFFTTKSAFRLYTAFSLIFILLLLISSCDTTRPHLTSTEPAKQEAEQNGILVECLHLNLIDITKRHGFRANPFIPPDFAVTPVKMIVLELTITNTESAPIRLDNRRVELHFGDRRFAPMSRSDMEAKIEEHAERRYILRENQVAQEFMLPHITTIRGYGTQTGYLVFMGPFRGRDVPTELVLPFTTVDGARAADITFFYTLTLQR
ncbi:MAG: hypothetical protein FWD87_00215 [Spirochaetaceae bacterium]|nr:hypothetical protein [Spirochaetaceae bacterium]